MGVCPGSKRGLVWKSGTWDCETLTVSEGVGGTRYGEVPLMEGALDPISRWVQIARVGGDSRCLCYGDDRDHRFVRYPTI